MHKYKPFFRSFLLIVASTSGCASGPNNKLIAHRGGVVDDQHAENSRGAISAAMQRGYWMIEVDVRESRDGRLVVHHDPDFQRFYGDPRRVAEMTWDEIHRLRATPGNSLPLEFQDVARLCRGRMRLMLDTKPPEHPDAFFQAMEDAMTANDLLESAFVIGTEQSRRYFKGKARVGVNREVLGHALEAGEDVARLYFLFEHGRDLDAETVAKAQRINVPVVASVNLFHYADTDPMKAAEADIKRLAELGVTYFQIDSVYEAYVPGYAP